MSCSTYTDVTIMYDDVLGNTRDFTFEGVSRITPQGPKRGSIGYQLVGYTRGGDVENIVLENVARVHNPGQLDRPIPRSSEDPSKTTEEARAQQLGAAEVERRCYQAI